jgi:hypothetical protein
MTRKDTIMIITACVMMASGVIMCYLSFLLDPLHRVDDSVLWYLGQCLVYASGVFGISGYVDYKVKDTFKHIKDNVK